MIRSTHDRRTINGKTIVSVVHALWKIIYANLEYLFYQVIGNQKILMQESSMSIIEK